MLILLILSLSQAPNYWHPIVVGNSVRFAPYEDLNEDCAIDLKDFAEFQTYPRYTVKRLQLDYSSLLKEIINKMQGPNWSVCMRCWCE